MDKLVAGAGGFPDAFGAFHSSWICTEAAQSLLVESSSPSVSDAAPEESITLASSAYFLLSWVWDGFPVSPPSVCWDLHFQFVFSNDSGGCFREDLVSWICFPRLIHRVWACLISQGWRFQQLPGAPWKGSKEEEFTYATQKSPYFKGYPVSPLEHF